MITFCYRDSKNKRCIGEIFILSNYDLMEMEIEANGWTFHVVVGRLDQGNFICIPNWNIGGELAGPSDVHWNEERLLQTTILHPDNVKAVVSGIAEAARWIEKYHTDVCG